MIDKFALGLTHLLLALAFWRLATHAWLDRDPPRDAGDGGDTNAS